MPDEGAATRAEGSARPSALRLRFGVLFILLWWFPFWVFAAPIAHALSGSSPAPSVAAVTTVIVVAQTAIGLLGLWLAGTQVKGIVKGTPKKRALKAIWSIFLRGQVPDREPS